MRLNRSFVQRARKRAWAVSVSVLAVVIVVSAVLVQPLLVDATSNHGLAASSDTPSLTVSGYISPTSQVRVNGDGFPQQEQAKILIDNVVVGTASIRSLDVVGLSGTVDHPFSAQITIPSSITPGFHTLSVIGDSSGAVVQSSIFVRLNWNQFGFDASGNRYNPYETVISPSNVSNLTQGWVTYAVNVNPVLVNGVVYVSEDIGENVEAVGEFSGKTLWGPYLYDPFTAPAVANGEMYFGEWSGSGYFDAVDAATGALRWYYAGDNANIEQFQSAPTIINGMVYVGSAIVATGAGKVYAFATADCGHSSCPPVWTSTLNGEVIVSSPAVVNGKLYIGTTSNGGNGGNLVVLDATTGSLLWTGNLGGRAGRGPAVIGGMVYIGTSNGALDVFDASGCGQSTCNPVWSGTTGGQVLAAPVVANGVAYAGSFDGKLYAFNASGCGKSTCSPLWTAATGNEIESSPAVANGVIFIGSNDGYIYAFNASGCGQSSCGSLWKFNTNSPIWSSPIVANGVLYVGNYYPNHTLYTFYPDAGGPLSPGQVLPGTRHSHASHHLW